MLYPVPKKYEPNGKTVTFGAFRVKGTAEELFLEAARVYGYPASVSADACVTLSVDPSLRGNDAYTVEIGETAVITGRDENAVARGIWTLLSLTEEKDGRLTLPCGSIEDESYMPFRGIHLFTPPADSIEEFKRLVAVAARLRFNTVFLEIGAGMEYERHPEINRAWTKFCRELRDYPAGPQGMQASEAYWKDSTHVELSGGGYITKAQMKEIVGYIRMMRMEVIPEIQSLSHSYYLTLADRSIAERPFERFPDSYCPMNERSYELYFDVAEEIIEVIRPERVSIGHDEIRVLGECPRCRGRSGAELLAHDLNKLHDFYAKHGIRIMMWGEKLQNFKNFTGSMMGGVEEGPLRDRYNRYYHLPATYGAIDRIPNDIIMLDWYYSMGYHTEDGFRDRGFTELYGNFNGSKMADWDTRSKITNVIGGEVSTWCVPDEGEIGMNGWFYEFAFSSFLLNRDDFHDGRRDEVAVLTERILPELRRMMRGKEKFDGEEDSLASLYLASPGEKAVRAEEIPLAVGASLAGKLAGNGLGETESLDIGEKAGSVVFFHAATDCPREREYTWYFWNTKPRLAASYAVDYADGTTFRVPVMFPQFVGDLLSDGRFNRPVGDEVVTADVDNLKSGGEQNESPMFAPNDVWRNATVYFSRAARFETDEGERSVYATEWKNPFPEKEIVRIRTVDEDTSPIRLHFFGAGLIG